MELNTQIENKILEAAEKVFYRKGKGAASMQDIADEAGITRTSLNYYFRSKDKLFESVFRNAMGKFIPSIVEIMTTDLPFEQVLPEIVYTIIDTMLENPQIPIFVLQELSSNPGRMQQIALDLGFDPKIIQKRMEQQTGADKMDPRQLIINVLSLCIFPFAARSMVQTFMFNGDETQYLAAMKMRKEIIPEMIKNIINN